MEVKVYGVIGAGQMGNGIAQVAAASGLNVVMNDIQPQFVDKGLKAISGNLRRSVEKGKMTAADKDALLGRIKASVKLDDLSAADFVVEAATEKQEIKFQLFRDLDRICRPGVILASNTSSIPIGRIAAQTQRPPRYNPPSFPRCARLGEPLGDNSHADHGTQANFIAGEWVESAGGITFQDLNPATSELIGNIHQATKENVERAIDAAYSARTSWANTPAALRERILLKAADLAESQAGAIADLLTTETGAAVGFAHFQVHLMTDFLRAMAGECRRVCGETMPMLQPGQFSMSVRRPLGVVGPTRGN